MQSNSSLAVLRRLLYNNNPFYVISAVLVLCGVWRSVAGQEALALGWPMFGLLCGYTVLLALAAWAIIRLGGVWQDARTLLVVIVLMLVALSMSFDAIAVLDLTAGRIFLGLGFAFAVAVSEALLRGLGVRLSWRYRGPYYATLILLFAYPAWLAELTQRESDTLLAWSLMAFPTLGAAIFLTLLPAARIGRTRKWATGAPWPWPLFPWTLFFFLALGLCGRTWSLAFGFESGLSGESGFRFFWLTPLLLVCALLALEMALAAGNRVARFLALAAPLGLLPLALLGAGANPTQLRFLSLLQESVGGPAQVTVWLLAAYYGWAWMRNVRLAEVGLMTMLALAAVFNDATVDGRTLATMNPAPLGAVLIVQLVLSVHRGVSWRMLAVAALAIGAACWTVHDASWVRNGLVPLHLGVLAVFAVGLLFDDALARGVRRAAPLFLPTLALLATTVWPMLFPGVPLAVHATWTLVLAAVAILVWRRERETVHLAAALANLLLVCAAALRAGLAELDSTPLAAGRDWLTAGLACLVIGLLISLAKGGVLRNVWPGLAAWNRRLQSLA